MKFFIWNFSLVPFSYCFHFAKNTTSNLVSYLKETISLQNVVVFEGYGDFRAKCLQAQTLAQKNKTGSSQVGVISKAQKYSKNNYWKHLEKLFFSKNFFLIFFRKVFFLENRTMPKNSKRGHSGSLNVFTNRKLQKMQGVTL